MANSKAKIKQGMGGSSSGKSRSEHTEVLKNQTKKRRRKEGITFIKDELAFPLATEPVQISSGHTITLDVNGAAKSLDLRGILNKQATKILTIQGN
jgi:hypothetical protein